MIDDESEPGSWKLALELGPWRRIGKNTYTNEKNEMSETKIRLLNKTSELFDLSVTELSGNARYKYLMPARFAMYKTLRERGWSYPRIGKLFGGKDHSTIIHGVRRADYMIGKDADYAAKVKALTETRLTPTALTEEEVEEQLLAMRKKNGIPELEEDDDWLEDLIHD